ncbi:hypothetical protein HMPREF0322_02002 [Desulfitobacterium hafniense DP7]|uniref:Uncharacterized protein n=1 Tax=Desulfitobacterium hafniense DP7 TaxID=537010 RepID=G9XM16_DESHA|nr:hypothetical protein HMPREF0322_02002 [Desulfitobacterium hafniense DP7]
MQGTTPVHSLRAVSPFPEGTGAVPCISYLKKLSITACLA